MRCRMVSRLAAGLPARKLIEESLQAARAIFNATDFVSEATFDACVLPVISRTNAGGDANGPFQCSVSSRAAMHVGIGIEDDAYR